MTLFVLRPSVLSSVVAVADIAGRVDNILLPLIQGVNVFTFEIIGKFVGKYLASGECLKISGP